MSWEAFNALLVGAKPFWLYRFVIGAQTFYYTSAAREFNTLTGTPDVSLLAPQTWTPVPVKMGKIRRAQKTSKNTVSVHVPKSDPLADAIIAESGLVTMEVTVWQGFAGDPAVEFVTTFLGTPQQIKPSYKEVILICMDLSSRLTNKGLARVIQAPCPYEIFGPGCALLEAPYLVTTTTSAMVGLTLTVAGLGAYADGYFNRGRLVYNGRQQTINSHVGTQITLGGAVAGLALDVADGSADVALLPGCRKSVDYCDSFGNVDNFGGLPELLTSPYTGDGLL